MFNTIVQRGVGFMLIAIIVYLLLRLIVFRPGKGKAKGVGRESFELKIYSIKEHCSDYSLKEFMNFLDKYKGGQNVRKNGHTVREFTTKEKAELQNLFYNVVAPAKDVSIAMKEQFRNYICNLKVDGVDMRPRYEDYTKNITDRHYEEKDKVVSYFADYKEDRVFAAIKKGLDPQKFVIIENPSFKVGADYKEFGHIVIGDTGIFVIASDLSVDILSQKAFIEEVSGDLFLDVHPIMVVSSQADAAREQRVPQIEYIEEKNLCNYVREYPDSVAINDRMMLVSRLKELSA